MQLFDVERVKQAARRFKSEVALAGTEELEGLEAIPSFGGAAAAPAKERKAKSESRRRYLAETSMRGAKALVLEADANTASFATVAAAPAPGGGVQPVVVAKPTQRDTLLTIAQERIIGSRDMVDLNYLEVAVAVSRAVARIRVGSGAGTGSLVGPRILMTNHHVIPSAQDGRSAIAQFDFQEDSAREPLPVQAYALDPDLFFLTDETLDFTLIGVAEKSERGRMLSDYPWLRLIESPGKVEKDDAVNIIQHPRGGFKQVALRNNTVIEIPGGKPAFLYYTTDTEPGSSGSPCFNDQWDVVALHHSGVPKMDGDKILKKDGTPFRDDVDDPATIEWIANEGARISGITAALKQAPLKDRQADMRAEMLEKQAPNPVELARASGPLAVNPILPLPIPIPPVGKPPQETPHSPGSVTFSIPLNITVSLGAVNAQTSAPVVTKPDPLVITPVALTPQTGAVIEAEEAVTIDPKWEKREGYNANFLGQSVPLPKLSVKMQADTVEVPAQFRKGADKFSFNYHHYSLAMNKKRRFAWFSAANIDGNKIPKDLPKRSKDKWFIDPRIDPDPKNPTVQCGEELYVGDNTDRGHLTRYLDVAWGANVTEAVNATNDTFHFSNCCLQLSAFNQGKDRWQGIEQYLMENKARKEKRQMCVFTGPIFKAKDNIYRNSKMNYSVRIPLAFWKVCVLERADGTLSATAFVLDQDDITNLPGFEEKFDVGAAQITVADLEKRTGLDFGTLRKFDNFAKTGAIGALEIDSTEGKQPIKPIEDYSDIVV